jgi:Zn-dependent peptidase ImmA (M78 family)
MINRHIEEKAEKVLREAGCFRAPVDISLCAQSLKIELNEVDLNEEVSGLFVIKDKMAHVGYNKWHHEHRQRFTIAHEIGHFLLHSRDTFLFIDKEEKVLYRDGNSSSGEYHREREANAFAAALLMPKKLLLHHILEFDSTSGESLQQFLARIFNVSETAMTIRLTNLGLIDFGLF